VSSSVDPLYLQESWGKVLVPFLGCWITSLERSISVYWEQVEKEAVFPQNRLFEQAEMRSLKNCSVKDLKASFQYEVARLELSSGKHCLIGELGVKIDSPEIHTRLWPWVGYLLVVEWGVGAV